MLSSIGSELAEIADSLYEQSEDDDIKMAALLRDLPEETAHALLTSNLTNAAQAYIYAFNEIPGNALYDLLLLKPSYLLTRGIVIHTEELAEIVFKYDKSRQKFFISVKIGDKLIAEFEGADARNRALRYARENCAE